MATLVTYIPRNAIPNLSYPQHWLADAGSSNNQGDVAGRQGPGGRFKAMKTPYNRYEVQEPKQ